MLRKNKMVNACYPMNFLDKYFVLLLCTLVLMAIGEPSIAADFDLPTVNVPGVTSNSSTIEIIVQVIKYIVAMVLWIFVIVAGIGFIKNVIKSVHKVRRDEEGKWADVVGDITGNAAIVILAILLATWVTTLLN